MESGDKTLPLILDHVEDRQTTLTNNTTQDGSVTNNTLSLQMIQELIESKKRQERKIEELERIVKSTGKEEKRESSNNIMDFFESQPLSPIINPSKLTNNTNNKFSTPPKMNSLTIVRF